MHHALTRTLPVGLPLTLFRLQSTEFEFRAVARQNPIRIEIPSDFLVTAASSLTWPSICQTLPPMIRMMFKLIISIVHTFMLDRADLTIENAALRQQLAILKDKHPRPSLEPADRVLWVALRKIWSHWANALIFVKPDTVVRWHRKGFRLYWRWKSCSRNIGRPKVSAEIRQLIRKMALDFAVTVEPYALWIVQQLREACPEGHAPRYVILDRDDKYGEAVPAALNTMGVKLA